VTEKGLSFDLIVIEKAISIIIPTLNEERSLSNALGALPISPSLEIIVVDGGSRDRTREMASAWTSQVYLTEPGRAHQMNFGARQARGEILLFLHADSILPKGGLEAISEALADPAVVGGAFHLDIDAPGWGYRLITFGANLRTRLLKLPYGDQGIFIKKSLFAQLGGFAEIPLMEDIDLIRRMKKVGLVKILPQWVLTSSRRWDQEGLLYTTLRNWTLALLYGAGVSPDRLHRWYRQIR